ncbi:MAG: carbon monoxide dehydrogenase subunit G [Actinomycetota bacterium]|nr:carbon monoxide dehydrogenase subunit G [Actinomycetota bacterium]
MKVSGTSVLHAPRAKVWQAINDPAVLAGVIPGCEAFVELEEGRFRMTVTLGVAAIKGSYAGEVRLIDKVEPSSLTMRASGSGGPGTIDTTVAVTLADLGDGTTQLDYQADAIVGGMVGGVGQRVLTSVAKKTAGLFFTAIDDVLTGRRQVGVVGSGRAAMPAALRPAVNSGAADGVLTGSVPPTRVGPLARAGSLPQPMFGAAALGAASMLIGVLVGARLGRRR